MPHPNKTVMRYHLLVHCGTSSEKTASTRRLRVRFLKNQLLKGFWTDHYSFMSAAWKRFTCRPHYSLLLCPSKNLSPGEKNPTTSQTDRSLALAVLEQRCSAQQCSRWMESKERTRGATSHMKVLVKSRPYLLNRNHNNGWEEKTKQSKRTATQKPKSSEEICRMQ